MEVVLSLGFGIGLFLCFVAIARSLRSRQRLAARMQSQYQPPRSVEELELQLPFEARIIRPILHSIATALARMTPRSNYEVIRHRLEMAGSPYGWTALDFLGARGLSGILVAVLLFFVATALAMPQIQVLLFVAIGAILGFYLPMLWLGLKISTRQDNIRLALPDALDLLTTCVEAGLGLDAAIGQVASKWSNDLARAFGQTLGEIRLGKTRREALRTMARRADVPDLTNFVAAVIQAEQLGVGIAKVLRVQSEQMRVKRRQRAQELANQAGVKMVVPLVFFFFPSMFVVILGPAVIRFVTKGLGF